MFFFSSRKRETAWVAVLGILRTTERDWRFRCRTAAPHVVPAECFSRCACSNCFLFFLSKTNHNYDAHEPLVDPTRSVCGRRETHSRPESATVRGDHTRKEPSPNRSYKTVRFSTPSPFGHSVVDSDIRRALAPIDVSILVSSMLTNARVHARLPVMLLRLCAQ